MKTEAICELPVRAVMLPDSHLYLWVTNNFLRDGFKVLDAWGAKYITTISWFKEGRPGLGQYFRGTTEHVLFARWGCPAYRTREDGKRAQGLTGFETLQEMLTEEFQGGGYFRAERPGGVHSRKPMQIHEWAEAVSHGPYLEGFARTARAGWTSWGNEAPGVEDLDDILFG